MINACFRGLTASLITDFSSAFDFNKPFVSYDISTGLFSIHTDNSMDFIGSQGNFDFKCVLTQDCIVYYHLVH